MLTRRGFLAASTLPALAAAPPPPGAITKPSPGLPAGVPASGTLAFRMIREGDRIGEHSLVFTAHPGGFTIAIAVDVLVKFGPIPVYRYQLRGNEAWQDGICQYAAANAVDNGTKAWMRANREAGALTVEGSRATRYRAPADALPASHWNRAELSGPWINIEDGKLLRPRVTDAGPAPALLADGTTIPATRYDLTGDARLRIWYAQAMWASLDFTAADGSIIRYERL